MRAENLAYKTNEDIVNKRVQSAMIDLFIVTIITMFFISFPLEETIQWYFLNYFWFSIITLIYLTFMESLFGFTIGKYKMKLRVIDAECNKPKLYQAFFRAVFWIIEVHISFTVIIGIAIYIITRKSRFKQRLGGKITGTFVVYDEDLKAFKNNHRENSMELDDYIKYLNTPRIIMRKNALNENAFNHKVVIIEFKNKRIRIIGIENMTIANVHDEIKNGAKFYMFYQCVSFLHITYMTPSSVYLIRAGQKKYILNGFHTIKTLLLGWWGIFGIYFTIKALIINLRGGIDMTDEILQYFDTAIILNEKEENKKEVLNSIDNNNRLF